MDRPLSPGQHWSRREKTIAVACAAMFVVAGTLFYVALQPTSPAESSPLTAQTIGVTAGFTGAACSSVTTCNVAATAAQYSVFVIFIVANTTTAPSAEAVHGQTPAQLEKSSATAPVEYIYGFVYTGASASLRAYVNFSGASYYTIAVADFANTVVTATYSSGTGTSSGSSSTAGTCAVTTTVANEMVVSVFGALHAEATMAPGQGTQLDLIATTTDVSNGENQYFADSSTGSDTVTNTLATKAQWRSACVGLLPAAVPTAPTGVTAGSITSTTVPLTWTPATGQSGYLTAAEVYWASYSGSCGSYGFSAAASTPFTSYTVTGLTSGSSYCFEVTASNGTGTSADSTALSDVTTLAVPTAPTGLATYAEPETTTQVVITWTLGTGTANNQTVEQFAGSTCTGAVSFVNIPDPTAQVYVATGLTTGTAYGWEVQGWDSTGEGAWSACVSGTTYEVPGAPTGLGSTAATTTSVSLAWTNPTPATGSTIVNVTVEMGTSCGSLTTMTSAGVVSVFTTAPNLNPYTSYCFEIGAWTGGGEGSLSSSLTVTTLAGTPAPVTGLGGSVTTTTVTATWTNPTPSSGSVVNDTVQYAANTGSCGSWTRVSGGIATSYAVTGLSASSTECIAVEDWTQGGGSSWVFENLTTSGNAPSAPTSLEVISGSRTSLVLTWTNPGGTLTNDTLQYVAASSCTGPYTYISAGVTTSYTIPGLTAATQYSILVRAWNAGGESAASGCVTEYTAGATPPAPVDLTAYSATTTTLLLGWQNPAGYLLYNSTIYVSAAGGSCGTWSQKNSAGGVTTGYTVTSLSPSSVYCIQVSAWDQESDLSDSLYAATLNLTNGTLAVGGAVVSLVAVGAVLLGITFVALVLTSQASKPKRRFK